MPSTQEFFNRQHNQLNRMETSIVKTRTDLESARNDTLDKLKAKREAAAGTRAAFHEKITGSVDKMKASAQARRAETDVKVAEWKRDREVNKLENRAKDYEDYAEAAMNVLTMAEEEALQASLEAIEARLQAEDAKALTAKA
jgi:hypothetical protein